VKNWKRFYTMPLKKRYKRVEVAERPWSTQNSIVQLEHGRLGERETRLLNNYTGKKMVPTQAHSVQNCRFRSLGGLKSITLDLLPNHNA